MEYDNYLIHSNPNHDPKNGQFSKSKIGSTAKRAAVISAAIGTGFAAERAISNKILFKDSDIATSALVKSSAYAFGRAAVASALAVIGDQLIRDHMNKKAVKKR